MVSASVLLVDLSKRFGGADVRVLQTARALHRAGRRYTVAVLNGSVLHQKLAAEGLACEPLPYVRADPRLALALYRLIRRDGYDVVDAHNPQSQYWAGLAAGLAGCRGRITTVHTVYREAHTGLHRPLVHEGALRLNRRFRSQFIVVSGTIRDYLRRLRVPNGDILLSYNGLEPLERLPAPAGLRASLGWTKENFVLVMAARLVPVKGHAMLLGTLATLRKTYPQLRCLIVGEGREEGALRALAERLGLADIVHFAGFRRDVPNVLAECDLFCLPSLGEGLPYAVLEAAQIGLPLLVSDTDGLGEVFTDRVDAVMVRAGSGQSLAEGVEWALTHPEALAGIAAAAQRMVQARFGIERMLDDTLTKYDQVGSLQPAA